MVAANETKRHDAEVGYWVGCTLVPGLGPVRFKRLLDYFGSAERAWRADAQALQDAGLDAKVASAFIATRASLSLDREHAKVIRAGAAVVTWQDPSYPALLREIYAPPPVLYLRGTLVPGDSAAVAVVGTRQVTSYGKQATERFVTDLVASGLTIVSGLARGVDTVAHKAALQAGGQTIAVLGNGVDIVYPAENGRLTEQIIENGAIISEQPMGAKPDAVNFPARNRIIAGLSMGTLVIEAGERSGALITADMALEMGREVFAVPGNIFSRYSQGTNRKIREGAAKLVATVQDVLVELNVGLATQQIAMKELVPENETESRLLLLLSHEPIHVDELARASDLAVRDVSGALLLMELKGMVRNTGGMAFVLGR